MLPFQGPKAGRLTAPVILVAAALAIGATGARSEDPAPTPTAAELINALQSKGPARGVPVGEQSDLIKALKAKSARGLSITAGERDRLADATKNLPAYDMDIPFDLNSAVITDRARPAIKALGEALLDQRLAAITFVVAGHTDASGPGTFNQKLSEERAEAVKKVLVSEYKLNLDQLIAVGYGPQQPKNKQNLFASENRRVQIVNVGE